MKKMNEFDNILDECLQRLVDGDSIEACLSWYPEHAADLEPLLRTAQDTLKTADISPRPEFRDRARYQFQMALRELPVKEKRDFFAILQPSLATVVVMAIVLLAGGGVVAAAGGSLPDSLLYQVKLATETVRLALTPSDLGKAELNAQFADERVNEILKMAGKGEVALVEATTERMNQNLLAIADLTGLGGAVLEDMSFTALQAPLAAPVPSPTVTPKAATPSATATPTETGVPPEEGVVGDGNQVTEEVSAYRGASTGDGVDREAQLRDSLAQQYAENIQALYNELEGADEALQPALRHAIEVAEQAYAAALENLFY